MKAFKDSVASALLPLLYINLAGMAAGAAWLVALGQWHVIWLGVMMLFFSPYLIPILMLPAGVMTHYMLFFRNAGQKGRERLMYACSLAYIVLFLTLWCVTVFEYVTGSVQGGALGAGLLWALAAALAPLFIWASRDRENIFVAALVETAQVAILLLCAARLFGLVASFWISFTLFGGIMALAVAARAVYESMSASPKKEAPR